MLGQLVGYRVEHGLAIIELNHPPANTYSYEMMREIDEAILTARIDEALVRIMMEMRHGWQMCYLLLTHFGSSGRVEAEKLLQRRAFKRPRLPGAFNEEVRDWLDFLVYTEFQDRDGKYQLTMTGKSSGSHDGSLDQAPLDANIVESRPHC